MIHLLYAGCGKWAFFIEYFVTSLQILRHLKGITILRSLHIGTSNLTEAAAVSLGDLEAGTFGFVGQKNLAVQAAALIAANPSF